jgi:uncharacterized protein (TIGR00251 family)
MSSSIKLLTIKVTPRSSRNEIVRKDDGALVLYTTAPPVDGAANAKVEMIVADALHIAKSCVRVVKGQKSRIKTIEVQDFEGTWPW